MAPVSQTETWQVSQNLPGLGCHYDLKKNVDGCDVLGVRPFWELTWRSGMFPIVFLTIRTPLTARDRPTVPMTQHS